MRLVRSPGFVHRIFHSATWKKNKTEKILYLTFDDGPVPEITTWVLDQLKRFNAKATFFCIGKNVESNPEIYSRIIREGHSTGNHTYRHLNGWKTSNKIYFDDVRKCSEVVNTSLFRPPYGKLKLSQYRNLKNSFSIIMWDVLSYDFDEKISGMECFENIRKNSGSGSIIVFHDSLKAWSNLETALPETLKYFTGLGFSFNRI